MHEIDRRRFLSGLATSAAGMLAGIWLPGCTRPAPTAVAHAADAGLPGGFVRIAPDGRTTVYCHKPEMGQGSWTVLPLLIAEELDPDPERLTVAWAPQTPPFTEVSFWGVEWSSTVRDLWVPLRRLGAGLRLLLVAEAADRWGVGADTCRTAAGAVIAPDGRRLDYGALAPALAGATLPADPPLKPRAQFRVLGRAQPNRLARAMATGAAPYGLDAAVDGMRTAVLARPPCRDAERVAADEAAARAVPGVTAVLPLDAALAVVAQDTWSALRGLAALAPRWVAPASAPVDDAALDARLAAAFDDAPTFVPVDEPAFAARWAAATARHEARYAVPFQSHGAIEPTSAIARVDRDGCRIRMACQNPPHVRARVAAALGIAAERVTVEPALMGGSFGRKYEPDPAVEAARLAQRLGHPVRVLWTREDETRVGPHRPAQQGRLRAVLDPQGLPTALEFAMAGPSYFLRAPAEVDRLRDRAQGFDGSTFEGVCPLLYPLRALRLVQHWRDAGIPVGSWRSTAHSMNTYFLECFVDELAARAGRDPLAYRRAWLARVDTFPRERIPARAFAPPRDDARLRRVIDRAAARAGWEAGRPSGVGLGLAIQHAYAGYAALVAEVDARRAPARIVRLVLVADLGAVANASGAEHQLAGGMLFGLAAVRGGLSLREGRIAASNFHDAPLPRLADTPAIEVELVDTDAPPAGAGEAGVPLVAPAVVNALAAATGRRERALPLAALRVG